MEAFDRRTERFIKREKLQIVDIDSNVRSDKELVYVFNNEKELREYFDNKNCADATNDTIALCILAYSKDKRLIVSKRLCDQVLSFYERKANILKLTK